jgi:hypothetical protein
MNLTLVAEVLSGETLISPGGPVDRVTACGLEPFLWQRWVHDAPEARGALPQAGLETQELVGRADEVADPIA